MTAARGGAVDILSCSHRYGTVDVLRDIDLHVGPGELVSLLGKSGSGKTTLLRIVAGLVAPTRGTVRIGGEDITALPPEQRDIGVVFQNYALFPHLTVFENTAFPLRVRGVARGVIRDRVAAALNLVGLENFGRRFPLQLSGGQQQRVAIARAIVFRPRLLLMDEPLGSLDKRLRQQLQVEFRRLQKEVGITTIYVTHDQDEAFAISDRIAVMERGDIRQIATPAEIYHAPGDRFVADFVGELNVFEGTAQPSARGMVLRTARGLEIAIGGAALTPGARISGGIRPERVAIGGAELGVSLLARLDTVVFKGSSRAAEAILATGERVMVELPDGSPLQQGDETRIGWRPEDMHLFGPDEARIAAAPSVPILAASG